MRTRGNGSGCVTSYMTAKNKRHWRVSVLDIRGQCVLYRFDGVDIWHLGWP